MRCLQCQHENRLGRRFCAECGAVLLLLCPACAFQNTIGEKFCGGCGTPLSEHSIAPGAPQGDTSSRTPGEHVQQTTFPVWERRILEAERRQLTVMFCDLEDSTALSVQLDPEDLREVLHTYQRTCADVIAHFEGYIAQYLGDGLLVYFGYPQAHEDDAQRAVYAGLGIVKAIEGLQARLKRERGIRLAVRVGIHTGLVVVSAMGDGDRHEQLALGDTPNIAARLQAIAEPYSVLISATTHRLVQGFVVCQTLDRLTVKGLPQPMVVYQALQLSGAQTRLDVAVARGFTPLVNRESEIALLLERWAQVKEGMGQVIVLSGEAGIGKSRLVQVLQAHAVDEPHIQLDSRCSPYHQNTALSPVIDVLSRALQWQQDDTPSTRLQKLEAALPQYHLAVAETVPLFAALLSLPLPEDRYPPLLLTPQQRKQKTLTALLALVLEQAAQQPVLFVIEDLHWVDPSTLEFLTLLIEQAPTAHLLALLTCRPVFRESWGVRAHLTRLSLDRLSRAQTETMLERMTGGKTLPAEVRQQMVSKTDGVPLFVEELTKMVLESEWLKTVDGGYELLRPLPSLAIPATLHDSLMARLDRLEGVKALAQLGATIGRQFSYTLLQALVPLDEATLQRGLDQLVDTELLYQRGVAPQATYTFKHALIQDAAYQSLLKSTREQYHRQIAQVLTRRFPDTAETHPELLAHHYTEAGLGEQAIDYWQRAAQHAIERSANLEAISHLTKALEILQGLPAASERPRQELALLLTLGSPLLMLKGNAAPEVQHVYTRALDLCQQGGESPQLFSVLMGLWRFSLGRGQHLTARAFAEQGFSLAQRLQDQVLLQEAYMALGSSALFLGEFTAAHTHLEQGLALYDPQQSRVRTFSSGTDPGVVCLVRLAWALWMLGYPEQARVRVYEALSLARESSHTYSLSLALHYAAILHQSRREPQLVREHADAELALAREQGFVQWLSVGMCMRGWALAEQGEAAEGIEQILQGLATWRSLGAEVAQTHLLVRLAEAYGRGGQAEEGLRQLDEALVIMHNNTERYYEAELYRLRGELLLQQAGATRMPPVTQATVGTESPLQAAAEACFRRALAVARQQQAKSLELRAVMSLCRLWQHSDRRAEALPMLAEIASWFTEGLETPDLQEAQALLAALA